MASQSVPSLKYQSRLSTTVLGSLPRSPAVIEISGRLVYSATYSGFSCGTFKLSLVMLTSSQSLSNPRGPMQEKYLAFTFPSNEIR